MKEKMVMKQTHKNISVIATLLFFLLSLGFFGLPALNAMALEVETRENVPVENKFPVGPTKFYIDAVPGQSYTRTIGIENRFGKERSYTIEIEDFEGSESDSTKTMILQGGEDGLYSARAWFEPEVWEFSNSHGNRTLLNMTVNIPNDADPGDHYASVLISPIPEDIDLEDDNNAATPGIRIKSRVAVGFFIRVAGEVSESGFLESFTTPVSYYTGAPIPFRLEYRNQGTVRLAPSGEIKITNMFGGVSDIVEVKEFNVLRNSIRGMGYEWSTNQFLAGKYTAELTLNKGYNDEVINSVTTFWVIPWKFLAGVVVGLIVVGLILRFLKQKLRVEVRDKDDE